MNRDSHVFGIGLLGGLGEVAPSVTTFERLSGDVRSLRSAGRNPAPKAARRAA